MASRKQTASSQSQTVPTVTTQEVVTFDRLKSQLHQLYGEITTLSKKSPDGSVNKFKLDFINEKVEEANRLLGEDSKPSKQFATFDLVSLPTNSDVVMMLSQYIDALEAWRSGHIVERDTYNWYWNTDDGTNIGADRPTRYTNR